MEWRRAVGAGIMLGGAAIIMAALACGFILAVPGVRAGASVLDILLSSVREVGAMLGGGVAALAGGRLVYGQWWRAAPIASVTGDITRTAGLLAAIAFGGLLAFLLASGFEAEDGPAALALGLGAVAGLWLARVGGNLRGRSLAE